MEALVGATVTKKFDREVALPSGKKAVHAVWLEGKVVHYDPFDKEHWVEYQDGRYTTLAKENLFKTHSEWRLVRAAMGLAPFVAWGDKEYVECSRCFLETGRGSRCACCGTVATGRAKRGL